MELSSMAAAIREYELRAAKRNATEALMFARVQKWDRVSVKMSRRVTDDVAEWLKAKGYNARTFGGRVIVYLGGTDETTHMRGLRVLL